ncbi:hypothetical protein [Altererythrobacter lutimaris]|uniref:hypothetical protein n=1 Tax=Altererythrobacter lutimaris TaxID=2743979 RepID=UPI001C3E0AD9|nr:hypothetical protein [Altererythrobacter lutimaris]
MSDKSWYTVPPELGIDHSTYIRWLRRKAATHLRRDRKRVDHAISGEEYRKAIHAAVCDHGTHDYYTGEKLDWSLISTYDNAKSKAGRSEYKAQFALLPTVDHVSGEDGRYDFVICAWRTNDAKNDLSYEQFVALCRRVIEHADQA